jgi:hypothetical protein
VCVTYIYIYIYIYIFILELSRRFNRRMIVLLQTTSLRICRSFGVF